MKAAVPALAPFAHVPLLPLLTALFMLQPLSTDFYLASLPALATDFRVPVATVQLTLSLFVIGFGSAQLVVGPLSDRYGRRPVLLSGLALYVVASVLCAMAMSIELLIAARFVQAIGCCAAVMLGRAIVRDAYAPEHSVRVIATASTWIAVTPLFGPIIGSYLQVAFGWRAAFVVHTVLSTMLFVMTVTRLPETNLDKDPRATNLAGLLANYRLILGTRQFWAHVLPGAFSYGAIFAFISGASLVLIRVLDVPTQWFGYCFAVGVSGYMGGTVVCRRLLTTLGAQRTFRVGSAVALGSGLLFLLLVSVGVVHWSVVVVAMFLTMGAHGINFPIVQSGAVSPFAQQAGTAAGLMGALYMIVAFAVGTIIGATANGTLYPLALTSAALGAMIFAAVRILEAPAGGLPQ